MWCYQKPGFKVLLLTELQRQQQCRHFCDTMLKTEDISVPAHSCILSAISPHIASVLSSTPSPPPGQSRLLEFQALGAGTLLRLVSLMYSGEMVGEGEKEKQEAVSAAAKLGIHGLVEVTTKHGENSQWVEVGVQTEPLLEKEKREEKQVRDVRDGSTIMWKERLSGGIKDMWTQTEQLQVNTMAPESTFETIDVTCLQNLRHTDSSVIPQQIPFIPMSLLYPPNENQVPQPSFAPMGSLQESTVAGPSSVVLDLPPSFSSLFSRETASIVHPPSGRTSSQVAAGNEWDDSSFEQFKGNISGYINDFLNPEKQEKQSLRGRPKGRRQKSEGTERAGACKRRPRRPPARAAGSGRGGFTETVDVQEVGLSTLQKLLLQRGSTRSSRTGQGGGAAGRKLSLKTREKLPKRRRRGPEKMSKVFLKKDDPLNEGGRARAEGCNNAQLQDEFPLSSVKAKPADGFLSPPSRFNNLRTAPASTPSLHPSPSPGLCSSAGSYVSPASSLLHNTAAPPSPHDEQVEQINRLLEEVMMGLDIFPNSSTQPVPPAAGGSCTYPISTSAETRQHGHAFVKGGPSGPGNRTGPVPQQQGESDFREMLENFLSAFEQEIHGCSAAEDEAVGRSQTRSPAGSSQAANQQLAGTGTPVQSRPRRDSACNATRSKRSNSRKRSVPKKPQKRRGRKEHLPSQQRLKDLAPPSELNIRQLQKQENLQLKQMPVVKLGRRGPLPDRMILPGNDNLNNNKSGKTESSSGKCRSDGKSQIVWTGKKMYPIRSKLRAASVDCALLLEPPLKQHRHRRERSKGRPQNGNVLDLSGNGQPAEQLCTGEQLQKINDIPEEDTTAEPQEAAHEATGKVNRRKAEVQGQRSEGASGSKRLCLEQMSHTTSPSTPQPRNPNCEPAAGEAEEVIDVVTLSLSVAEASQEDKAEWKEINPREAEESSNTEELEHSSCDEIIVVDGDGEDEDIDVLGGSSLVTHQMSIPWSETLKYQNEAEEEEINVVS